MAPKAETIKRSTTADKVFDILHQWIASGRLQEGDVLPSQDELSRRFEVSRNTLREAIFKLSALGLVQAKQGVGTVVRSRSSANYLSGLEDHLLMDRISMREFLEARVSIETTIVRLAVARASQEDIDSKRPSDVSRNPWTWIYRWIGLSIPRRNRRVATVFGNGLRQA